MVGEDGGKSGRREKTPSGRPNSRNEEKGKANRSGCLEIAERVASPDVIIDDDDDEQFDADNQYGIRNPYPKHVRMILLAWLNNNKQHLQASSSAEYATLREATGLNNGQIKVRG